MSICFDSERRMKYNIVYVHGFNSKVKPNHEKYEALASLDANVYPIAPDYSKSYNEVLSELRDFIGSLNAHLIVGSSLGANFTSQISEELKVPFIGINPCVFPSRDLPLISKETNETLLKNYRSFRNFNVSEFSSAYGACIVALADEVLNSYESINVLRHGAIDLLILEDESLDHRLKDISSKEILNFIEKHLLHSNLALGSKDFLL